MLCILPNFNRKGDEKMAVKIDEKLAELGLNLDDLSKKVASASEDAKAYRNLKGEAIKEKIDTAKGNMAALQEKARIAEEENKSKLSGALLKAQMTANARRQDRLEAKDKKLFEMYLNDQVDFVLDCFDSAVLLIANAQLAILETLEAAAEYEARYGEKAEVK